MIQRLGLIGIIGLLQAGCVAAVLGNAPTSGTAADTRLRGPSGATASLQGAGHLFGQVGWENGGQWPLPAV